MRVAAVICSVLLCVGRAAGAAVETYEDVLSADNASTLRPEVYEARFELGSASGPPLVVAAEGRFLYGLASGEVQTPSGGRAGTTTLHRPTLDELGIEHASAFDLSGTLGWGQHEIYLGGQWLRMSGSATLGADLTTQERQFLAGSEVDAHLQFDWYRVGYRHRFGLADGPGDGPRFILSPSAGAAMMSFDYELSSPGLRSAHRSYSKVAPQLGMEIEWRATERLSVVGAVSSTVPISNMPLIVTAEVVGRYRVVDREAFTLTGTAGLGFESVSYKDNQDVPNHVEVDLGPMLILGLQLQF
jgi:hypothetical protein